MVEPSPTYLRLAAGIFVSLVTLTSPAWAQGPQISRRDGYLFIDGEYISPPYEVSRTNSAVVINGKKFGIGYFQPTSRSNTVEYAEQDGQAAQAQRGQRNGRNENRARQATVLRRATQQVETAAQGATVILYRREAPVVIFPGDISYRLLRALEDWNVARPSAPSHFSQAESVTWDRLVTNFEPSQPFLDRLNTDLDYFEQADMQASRISGANRLVAQISYPMTIFAMGAIVVAFGHLLSTRPTWEEDYDESSGVLPVNKSLVMIAVFSSLDLIWTLAATEAGTMRELNPLGSQLIEDPMLLVLFKFVLTGSSIGILYKLHRRPIAQVASWWCCLVLMLLTARWVVFQSMFT